MVIVFLTFVIVAAVILGMYGLFVVVPERRGQATWRKRLTATRHTGTPLPDQSVIREARVSSLSALNTLLMNGQRLTRPLQEYIDRAGLPLTPGAVVLASCCAAMLLFVLVGSMAPVAVALAAGVLGSTLPLVYLRRAHRIRKQQFEELFPEALEVIARALRAGHTLATGIALAADEVPEPVAREFKLLYDWQNFGRPLDDALRCFAERAPILDARFFATAVLTQRETGGNLSEVLDNLVSVIRDRATVKRQVRTLTAQGRLSGWVLAAAPPVLAVLLLLVNPDHLMVLVRDPIGLQLIAGGVVLQIAGTLLIRRIVNVEY